MGQWANYGVRKGTMMEQAASKQSQYPVTVNFVYPEKLSRLTTFFRIFLAIPQVIALYFVTIVSLIATFAAWWCILFTGKYPKSLFNFVAGTQRWSTRLNSYSSLLTDKYPPFSMD